MVLLSDREHRDAGSVRNRRQTCKETRKCSSQSYLSSFTPAYSASVILLQNFNQTQSRQRSMAFPLSAQQTSYKKPTEVHPKHFHSPGSITSCRAGELHSSHPSRALSPGTYPQPWPRQRLLLRPQVQLPAPWNCLRPARHTWVRAWAPAKAEQSQDPCRPPDKDCSPLLLLLH